jgi:organic hydroperoxide reductase OsmC/OhrA
MFSQGEAMRDAVFTATVTWTRGEQAFTDKRYSRAHTWGFDGGLTVPASSSPLSVPLPMSNPACVDPEEALVASASSCHMLFFLALAAQKGLVVDEYRDEASGTLGRDERGRLAMREIRLRPAIRFSGASQPGADELAALHHEAHEQCYVANSLKAEIIVETAPDVPVFPLQGHQLVRPPASAPRLSTRQDGGRLADLQPAARGAQAPG